VVVEVRSGVRPLDYRVPAELADQVTVGSEVRVALGPRRLRGWVVALDTSSAVDGDLKPLLARRGVGPPPRVVAACGWAAWRYGAASPAPLLGSASSPRVVRSLPAPGPFPPSRPATRATAAGWPAVVRRALEHGGGVVRIGPAVPLTALADAALGVLASRPAQGGGPKDGAGVVVVVPERADAQQVAEGLRSGGWPVALLPEDWAAARAGGRVVVGSRAAAFAPLPALAGAVVLDGHDRALREQAAPTWWAPEVLAQQAKEAAVPWLATSPCPTAGLLDLGPLSVPPRAVERAGWPAVEVVDLARADPREGLVSGTLVRWCRWAHAEPGRRVVVVLNRLGEARRVRCARCRALQRCEGCATPLQGPGPGAPAVLSCPTCGAERPLVCAACGATRLRQEQPGAARFARALAQAAGVPVALRTAEGTAGPAGAAVVVGTEAALRGEPADLVAFADLDPQLLAPRVGASAGALALLARAARLVGRSRALGAAGRAPGRLVLQTRQPEHPAVRAALLADPTPVTDADTAGRREVGLPPFTCRVVLHGPTSDEAAGSLADGLEDARVVPLGAGRVEVRSSDREALLDRLAALRRPAGLVVAVDPDDD
jgi:primosomal protein N' (replication factor Y)